MGQELDSKIQLDTGPVAPRTSRLISCLLSTPSCLNRFIQQEFRGNLGDDAKCPTGCMILVLNFLHMVR
ncbi:hypothetical protein BS78_02G074500 [Paspalum vaginatum]|nr:hypothetical protein BS78_02G074500 [Paspalum vaginatum]